MLNNLWIIFPLLQFCLFSPSGTYTPEYLHSDDILPFLPHSTYDSASKVAVVGVYNNCRNRTRPRNFLFVVKELEALQNDSRKWMIKLQNSINRTTNLLSTLTSNYMQVRTCSVPVQAKECLPSRYKTPPLLIRALVGGLARSWTRQYYLNCPFESSPGHWHKDDCNPIPVYMEVIKFNSTYWFPCLVALAHLSSISKYM